MNTMPFNLTTTLFSIEIVWVLLKILFLLGAFLYILFAVIMMRQVRMMIETLHGGMQLPIRVLAVMHLLLAIGVFLLALIVL